MSVLNNTPSTKNCTCVTPTLSDAVAEIVIVALTVAPPVGLVILVVGGVVSDGGAGLTVIVTFADDAPAGPMAVRI